MLFAVILGSGCLSDEVGTHLFSLMTLRDESGWRHSLSIIPQVSCHAFSSKYRNTATSLVESIGLVFPDGIRGRRIPF